MNVLVLIQRQSLQIYYSDHDTPTAVMIPQTMVQDLEVINEKELDTLLAGVLLPVTPKTPMSALLLIDDAVCFSVPLEVGKEEEAKKALINDVPFLHVANVTIPFEKNPLFVTTNQNLYESIGRVFEAHGYSILGVYPWHVVGYLQLTKSGEAFGSGSVKRLFESIGGIRQTSFPYHNQEKSLALDPVVGGQVKPKKLSVGWIIFISLAILYAIGMVWYMFFRR